MVSRLWNFLSTDINGLTEATSLTNSADHIEGDVDHAAVVLKLAEVLTKPKPYVPEELGSLVTQLDSLLDAFNSPLKRIAEAKVSFVPIGVELLRFYTETTHQEPTIAQRVALVSQAAYLDAIKTLLADPSFKQLLDKEGDRPTSNAITQKIKQLALMELEESDAKQTLLSFQTSELAAAYSEVFIARITELGIKPHQAGKIALKLARDTHPIMVSAFANYAELTRQAAELYQRDRDLAEVRQQSIETYLQEQIAPLPHARVRNEAFSFKDIYVPRKAQYLTTAGKADVNKASVELESWARKWLQGYSERRDQVLVLEGASGRGKSIFCRLFADWVRRHEHPRWTPILIHLQDVKTLAQTFEATLATAVGRDFTRAHPHWLSDRSIKFLFLLDGADALQRLDSDGAILTQFWQQVNTFQQDCAMDSKKGHRVIVTTRSLALQTITDRLPSNLMRLEILPINPELQRQWCIQWARLTGQNQPELLQLLKNPRLPDWIRDLAREPRLLQGLAVLHRDGKLQLEPFGGSAETRAELTLFHDLLNWLLEQLRPVIAHGQTELDAASLRHIWREAALAVEQSSQDFTTLSALHHRLLEGSIASTFWTHAERAPTTLERSLNLSLGHELGAFYLRLGQPEPNAIEFVHPQFAKFLSLECIAHGLVIFSQMGSERNASAEDGLAAAAYWAPYDLLSAPVLTPEMLVYLMPMLMEHPDFQAAKLHRRLYDFYWRWCQGEFIDAPAETLPQRAMRLRSPAIAKSPTVLGQRQIEAQTGLNTLILLLELHRYGQIQACQQASIAGEPAENALFFHACSHPDYEQFDGQQFRRVIQRSQCLGENAFQTIAITFLKGIDLRGANLSRVDLSSLDLSEANLRSADLSRARLNHINLSGANLQGTHFQAAKLAGANLSSANLRGAKLTSADLQDANLTEAELQGADLRRAMLTNADLSATNLESANLTGTELQAAKLCSANLKQAHLSQSNLFGVNLSGANLSSANLSGANLSRTQLFGANLSRANLSGTDLSGTDLSGTNLSGTDLSGANLNQANLTGTNLSGADLSHADLRNANLSGATLERTNLSSANLNGVELTGANLSATQMSGINLNSARLCEVNLSGLDLSNANLRSVNLSNGTLNQTNFSGADLRNADFTGASLIGTNFFGANLFEADLSEADLMSADCFAADLGSANLSSANLDKAKLNRANLFEANLSGATLSGADLFEAVLSGADLSEADLSEADLGHANLAEADLQEANLRQANLSKANLARADLRNANVSGANLRRSDMTEAVLADDDGILQWNAKTVWDDVEGLDDAIGILEVLEQNLADTAGPQPPQELLL